MTALSLRYRYLDRSDLAIIGLAVVLAVGSIFLFTAAGLSLRIVAPALDLALDTIALVVTASVAALAWVRFRERGEAFAAFESAAFLAIALGNLTAVIMTVALRSDSTLVVAEPGAEQLAVFSVTRLMSGVLLVAGAAWSLRRAGSFPAVGLVAGSAAAVTLAAVHLTAGLPFPALIERVTAGGQPVLTLLGVTTSLAAGVLYGLAAWLVHRLWRRDGATGDRYVALGLVLASFAQVHSAVFPGTHPGPVTSADVLRLGFDIVLLLAIEAEASSVLRSLRRANDTLEELRAAEVERAAIDERTRLSRELHDGLAQSLWLAKLRMARLTAEGDLGKGARALADEAAEAIELGLAEARQAVLAMRVAADTQTSFRSLLERYLEDHGDRFGVSIALSCDTSLPTLPARTQAELLRIVQEALANVRRHSGASSVDVRARLAGGDLVLTVRDDGRGFRPEEVAEAAFGLMAMRERAALIGGRLTINSEPGRGTEIRVTAPVGGG